MRIRLSIFVTFILALTAPCLAQPPEGQPRQGQRTRPGQASQSPEAAATPGSTAKEIPSEVAKSVTRHSITLNGASIAYTATAGQIPIRNEDGDIECRMFYVAYSKEGDGAEKRPITFAFNGGPGSASLFVHMGALGPKRAPMNDDGSLPTPPYAAVDNEESWLDFTDIVCVDAPATGYSRIVKKEFNSKFFGVNEDIAAFTEFVRGWIHENKRWRSPIIIAGESYGGIRGSGLCNSLFRSGIAVSGFVSISGTSNYLTLSGMRGNDATYIGFLPSMAACAWYHNKVSHSKYHSVGDLVNEVIHWTDTVYASALELGDGESAAEKDKVAAQLAGYLGLSKKYCLGSNLKINAGQFRRELLRDDSLSIGRYDGRLVGKEETQEGFGQSPDPSDQAVNAPFITSANDYLDRDLGIKTDLTYIPSANVQPWKEQEGGYSETASALSALLLRNPHFRVLYCCGYYDLACPLNATRFTVNHMGLDAGSREHVSFAYYPAGHMMYIEKSSRKKLHDDVSQFVSSTLSATN